MIMGLWGKIKKGIKKAANKVKDFVNDVGDAVGNAVEAVGDAINDGLNWLGEKLGIKPVFSWLGGVLKGAFALISAVIKGVIGIIGGIISGVIKIVGGLFTGQWDLMPEGLWDIVSPIIGAIIIILGKAVALIQSVFYAQDFERPLTHNEESQLRRVFKDALNYYVIRIIEGHSGLFGINSRPFTLGNTIYMKTDAFAIDILVHEVTHVWQYQQTGSRYASDALTAQWFVDDAYNWQKEINDRGKSDWNDFNKEAQAEFFQDLWLLGARRDTSGAILSTGNGTFFDADGTKTFGHFEVSGNNYTNIADRAVATVRDEW